MVEPIKLLNHGAAAELPYESAYNAHAALGPSCGGTSTLRHKRDFDVELARLDNHDIDNIQETLSLPRTLSAPGGRLDPGNGLMPEKGAILIVPRHRSTDDAQDGAAPNEQRHGRGGAALFQLSRRGWRPSLETRGILRAIGESLRLLCFLVKTWVRIDPTTAKLIDLVCVQLAPTLLGYSFNAWLDAGDNRPACQIHIEDSAFGQAADTLLLQKSRSRHWPGPTGTTLILVWTGQDWELYDEALDLVRSGKHFGFLQHDLIPATELIVDGIDAP